MGRSKIGNEWQFNCSKCKLYSHFLKNRLSLFKYWCKFTPWIKFSIEMKNRQKKTYCVYIVGKIIYRVANIDFFSTKKLFNLKTQL